MSFAQQFKPTTAVCTGIDPNRKYTQPDEMLVQTDLGQLFANCRAQAKAIEENSAVSTAYLEHDDLLRLTNSHEKGAAYLLSYMSEAIQGKNYTALAELRDTGIRQTVQLLAMFDRDTEDATNHSRACNAVDALITDLHVYHDTLKQPPVHGRVWNGERIAFVHGEIHVSRFSKGGASIAPTGQGTGTIGWGK